MIYDIEWDQTAYDCGQYWQAHGIDRLFLLAYPDGASWGCDVCDANVSSVLRDTSLTSGDTFEIEQRCLTCGGYPPGHPECAGVPFAQTFQDIPRAMWFVLVTVTTVGCARRYTHTHASPARPHISTLRMPPPRISPLPS